MSTRIKICGITRLEDARVAANLGVMLGVSPQKSQIYFT